eukprot:scaffold58617_cov24-Cyclotella_meneghiniana.AAC.2
MPMRRHILKYTENHPSELLTPKEQARQQCIEYFIKGLDCDGDGKVSNEELYLAMRGFYDDVICANEVAHHASSKIRKHNRTIGGLVALTVALVAAVFGTSFAAANLAKDTQVNNRALLTKDNQPVGINLIEIDVFMAALAFVPSSVASKIHELVLADDDGKSVTLHTTHGDTISWDVSEESKNTVMIEFANGKAWEKSSLCAACTATSVVADDSVLAALDDFHASIGIY